MNLLSPILKGDRRKSQTSQPRSLPALLHRYQFKQKKENADLELMWHCCHSQATMAFCFVSRTKPTRFPGARVLSYSSCRERKHRKPADQKSTTDPKGWKDRAPFATKKQRCVYVEEVSKGVRPGSSVGKYHTHVFMCANSNLAVHYKFIFIKTDGHSVKGTEKISVPKSIMGNPPSLPQGQMITLLLPSQ